MDSDEDATLHVPSPEPPRGVQAADSEARGLPGAGQTGGTLEPGPPPPPVRGWQAPSVASLQEALPEYDIVGLIARGGMGAVYKGLHKRLRRFVAIKVLPPEIGDRQELRFTERFEREAQAMARLSHPSIVAVFDAGETTGGLLYFVMEFVEGTDVQKLVRARGRLPPEEAMAITAYVCDALAFAHEEGIIHRDIKPSNIMVNKRGRVKVADFGLAKVVSLEEVELTGTNMAMGTPDYVAPETLTPGMKVDHRADLYAVGVMLYLMLTGQTPRGRFLLPSTLVPDIDPRLDAIVDRAMQTDRETRYGSAVEMRDDLDRVATQPLARQNFAETAAGSTAIKRKTPPAEPPRAWRRAKTWGLIAAALMAMAAAAGGGAWLAMRQSAEPFVPLSQATLATPFSNTLGMKFVPLPVPGTTSRVLMCMHETRVADFAAFVASGSTVGYDYSIGGPAVQLDENGWGPQKDTSWDNPGFTQADTHPVTCVSWDDAVAFCQWLTLSERTAGRIGPRDTYRLPSDYEWSCAVGIEAQESGTDTPGNKDSKIPGLFPWLGAFPPATLVGNFAGEESRIGREPGEWRVIPGYRDGFARTMPVMTLPANRLGLHDLSGNVWEWCEDSYGSSARDLRVMRGGAWSNSAGPALLSSCRGCVLADKRGGEGGFRCVLAAVGSGNQGG